MDAITARIKDYVLTINPDLYSETGFLDLIVKDVVNRALMFMNRVQLIAAYEADNTKDAPIPEQLETTLALVIIGAFKTIQARNEGEMAVDTISDYGQSIKFKAEISNYLNSGGEAEIFSESLELMRRYYLPTVYKMMDEISC